MIPTGYMAKRVLLRPEWLHAERVRDVYSLSGCLSKYFADYIQYWKHNGYWLFDSPQIIRQLADEQAIDLTGTKLFYYEVHELEFDETNGQWAAFAPEPSFTTQVAIPALKVLEGYDVVTFNLGNGPECSPLSCNRLADNVDTNAHCLLGSLEEARELLESGQFAHSEPGPFRMFAVYSVDWDPHTPPVPPTASLNMRTAI